MQAGLCEHLLAGMGQSMSFGLTQLDVDELITYSRGACESWGPPQAHGCNLRCCPHARNPLLAYKA